MNDYGNVVRLVNVLIVIVDLRANYSTVQRHLSKHKFQNYFGICFLRHRWSAPQSEHYVYLCSIQNHKTLSL